MTDIDKKPAAEPADARNAAPATAAPTAEPPNSAPSPLAGVEELVERWWHDHFPGSAVARDTQAWNHAHRAKDELKRRLAALTE